MGVKSRGPLYLKAEVGLSCIRDITGHWNIRIFTRNELLGVQKQ